MEKLTQGITKILGIFLTVLMAVMVLDVTWQVFTRFLLQNPSSFTEELAGFLLIWIGVLGAAYALHTRAHLGIEIISLKLTGRSRQALEIVIYLVVMLFALFIMVIGGMRLVNLTFTLNQISPALGIKMGYVYLVVPLSGILFIYYSIDFIIKALLAESTEPDERHVSVVD